MTQLIARLMRDEAGLTAIEYSLFTTMLGILAINLLVHR